MALMVSIKPKLNYSQTAHLTETIVPRTLIICIYSEITADIIS